MLLALVQLTLNFSKPAPQTKHVAMVRVWRLLSHAVLVLIVEQIVFLEVPFAKATRRIETSLPIPATTPEPPTLLVQTQPLPSYSKHAPETRRAITELAPLRNQRVHLTLTALARETAPTGMTHAVTRELWFKPVARDRPARLEIA